MKYTCTALLGLCFLFGLGSISQSVVAAEPISKEAQQFFEAQVRPLLAEKCWSCHGPEKQKGGLRLDSLGHALQGGESGPSIVTGKPDESLLVEAIRYQSFEMPPNKPLSDREVAVLVKWVSMGAPWPGSDPNAPPPKVRERFTDEDRQWWAIQPVQSPKVPSVAVGRINNEIDNFILDRLQSAGLTQAPEADRATLARRLYFDVIGLPPTAEQVEEFVRDQEPHAYDRLVDRLLDSPAYGENATRQWLDLVRYADSDGYRADGYRPDAWRYRDYVIRSMNDDKPYDRFVQEQIAGDEMFPESLDAQVALGYLRHWVYEWNIRDAPGQWNTIMEDVTDTTADVFMGLGLQCAKCHDHKFDPLLRKDYFRLRAFFAPLMPKEAPVASAEELSKHAEQEKKWNALTAEYREEIDRLEAPHRVKLRDRAINRFPEDIQQIVRKPTEEKTPYELQLTHLVELQVEAEYKGLEAELSADDKSRVLELKRKIETFAKDRPEPLPMAMVVSDVGPQAPPTHIPKKPNEDILPGLPTILMADPLAIDSHDAPPNSTGRRTALAKWLTDPTNPLTTRVIVNRIWQSHFGRGLAMNTSDFGRLGEPPTHPELLDWLTHRFVEDRWSLKGLHRIILNSATYRQSSTHPDSSRFQTIDPANRYYWRGDTRRLPAEKIRDAILVTTEQLKERNGGPGATPDVPCRSIYTRAMRNSPDELLESFDLPLFFSSNSSRNTTTTPVQSLLMINSELMLGHARKLAQAARKHSDEPLEQIRYAWRRVYAKDPNEYELKQALGFVENQTRLIARLHSAEENEIIETGKLPYRSGQAVRFVAEKSELQLTVPELTKFEDTDFTAEAFFQLKSIDSGAGVRTLVAKWNGALSQTGWGLGITGQGSRRKPQTIVLQLVGQLTDGKVAERALFSDQHVEINKPYYVAASVKLATAETPGSVTFYLKDLSNDDEPMLTATLPHDVVGGFSNKLPMTIGGLKAERPKPFDGLIDDVRIVSSALNADQLMYPTDRMVPGIVGLWQFEAEPGVMRNSLDGGPDIQANGGAIVRLKPSDAAMADFCHALLNSNEFLYVQ